MARIVSNGTLNDQQSKFVSEYLKDLNGKQAAIRAGYKASRAEATASELLGMGKVSKAVEAGKARQLQRADLSAGRVLEELRRLGFSDIRLLFDEKGNLRPIHTLTAEQAACIGGLEIVKRNLEPDDGKVDTVIKIKVWDKVRSLETLAKHFMLLTDRLQVVGDEELIKSLHAGRKLAAERTAHLRNRKG